MQRQLEIQLVEPKVESRKPAKPFLKWAGGKRQLLSELVTLLPVRFDKYIEPFLGGGALFFHLGPVRAILADANEELISCYEVVRDSVIELIDELRSYRNDERSYYEMRELLPSQLGKVQRAARVIYLNKTGFNGLYRVNKEGHFNVPFGHRKNPIICDVPTLQAANEALQGVELVCGDYKDVLRTYARPGDFVFLDPPYYPVGGYADFKRFTKEFFYEENHLELRDEFARLVNTGCWVLLTNSNTSFVRKLYEGYNYKAVDTRRSISSNSTTRSGEDLIVIATRQPQRTPSQLAVRSTRLLDHFPGTRYMGSKYRILPFLWQCVQHLEFESVLDAFSGSGCVSYMFKQYGKQVVSNDFLHFSYHFAKALVENADIHLGSEDIEVLMHPNDRAGSVIADTFRGLYFADGENVFLDSLRANVELLDDPYKKSLALAAITRACLKKRPRGIFTYLGDRYDDGRRDIKMSLQQHFLQNVEEFNGAVFDNGKQNLALNTDVFGLKVCVDLVYLDPPYLTPNSDNDYTRRYHFVEGLVRGWQGLQIDYRSKTRKFKRYETPFLHKDTVCDAFDCLFEQFRDSILVISYSSNSIPDKSDLVTMLKRHKPRVHVHQVEHLYSVGNQGRRVGDNANRVQEFVFVAY